MFTLSFTRTPLISVRLSACASALASHRFFATHKQPTPPLTTSVVPSTPGAAVMSDVLSHVHDRHTRVLFPVAIADLEALYRIRFPEKCNIQTLTSVFSSFATSWLPGKADDVYFEYDGFMWRATIRSHVSHYAHREVAFTNIKLPNDGFFYTSDYNNGGTLIESDATSRFMQNIIGLVQNRNLLKGNPGAVEVKYFEAQQRVAVYLWNDDRSACVTVKFEYGYHEGAKEQKAGQFLSLLEKWKEDVRK